MSDIDKVRERLLALSAGWCRASETLGADPVRTVLSSTNSMTDDLRTLLAHSEQMERLLGEALAAVGARLGRTLESRIRCALGLTTPDPEAVLPR